LLERGVRVLDLSADFRLRDAETYTRYYGEHPCPALLSQAVYGLVEHRREALHDARLVAVPGCYPTSVALSAAPLLRAGLVSPDRLLAACASGVSGAGREAKVSSLLCEAGEGMSAYGVGTHRHQPEMEQELSWAAGRPVTLTFVPHLAPMSRGIHATVVMDLLPGVGTEQVVAAFEHAYASTPFVRWLGLGGTPSTTHVRGSNRAFVGAHVDARLGRVVVTTAIDNLVKGASGQAIQCLNAVYGWPETLGLEAGALFP
jgi:N-acetyl-gamma-glutamyl-phosphate reductase